MHANSETLRTELILKISNVNAECPRSSPRHFEPQILQPISRAMVTHIIQTRVHELSTSSSSLPVLDLHIRRPPPLTLAHVLTVFVYLLSICLDPSLLARLVHFPTLPVELDLLLGRAVVIVVHGKAYFVLVISWFWRGVIEWPRFTVQQATMGFPQPTRPFPLLFSLSVRTPFRICLQYLFLLCPRECLAYKWVLSVPSDVVSTNVRFDALSVFG